MNYIPNLFCSGKMFGRKAPQKCKVYVVSDNCKKSRIIVD